MYNKQQQNTTHQKWSNYETNLCSLWLTNESSYYPVLTNALKLDGEIIDKANWLGKRLRWQLEDEITESCLWQDLLNTAFDRIEWTEVIKNNLD